MKHWQNCMLTVKGKKEKPTQKAYIFDNLLLLVQEINIEILPNLKSLEHKRVLQQTDHIYVYLSKHFLVPVRLDVI